ncbi:hypothetical protein Tco_1490725 [Tanacetum coccineum]
MDKCKTGLGYNVVPPPYTRNFVPPKPYLVYPSLYDFVDVNESVSEFVVKKPTVETKIHIDNESTICIVKNPIFNSKTKHIEIRHHFIRDSNEKKLIQMIKIQTDQNVIDLLTKAFNRIIHKGWLEWNVTAAKDGIGVKTGNLRVNAAGHYLVVHEERGESVERAANTATSLDAEQDGGNITRTQSTAMPNVPLP